jgi:hypothetical protein
LVGLGYKSVLSAFVSIPTQASPCIHHMSLANLLSAW